MTQNRMSSLLLSQDAWNDLRYCCRGKGRWARCEYAQVFSIHLKLFQIQTDLFTGKALDPSA